VFALLTLAGMAGASVSAASGRAVMGWFAADERGFALGIRQTAVPLGWAIAALALPPVVHAGGLSAGLAALRIGCLGRAAGRLPRRRGGRRAAAAPSAPLRGGGARSGAAAQRPPPVASVRGERVLRRRADRADLLRGRLPA